MGKASLLYNKLLYTVYIYDYIDLSFLYISCMYTYSYATLHPITPTTFNPMTHFKEAHF